MRNNLNRGKQNFLELCATAHPEPSPDPNSTQLAVGLCLDRMIEKSLQHPLSESVPEDAALLAKLKPLMRPDEKTILAFIARVGLGPRPLKEWSVERIEKFVSLANERAKNEVEEPGGNQVRVIPKKFSLY